MVARPGQYQASLNAGELAPAVWGRSDIKQFYSGASLMQNAEPVPQGGFAALPGTAESGRARGPLSAIPSTGTVATVGPHAAPATIFQAVFARIKLSAVDVTGLSSTIPTAGQLRIEVSPDGVSWVPFGQPFSATATPRNRRIAVAPGEGAEVVGVRLRLFSAPAGAVTFGLAGFLPLAETALVPELARIFEHTFSVEDSFTIVLTPGNADVWKGDVFQAAVATPISAAILPNLTREQSLNTMLLWHVDLTPFRIMRRDNDYDWSGENVPFVNLPLVDYGGVYANVVTDAWRITITWSGGPAGLILEINLDGEEAQGVELAAGPNWAGFAAGVQAALEALPSVAATVNVTHNAPGGSSATLDIAFAGNPGQRFALTPRISNVSTAAAIASHITLGDPGGEDIMSSLRGWPATGNFFQGRLNVAGFKSEPGALLASVSGEFFDLNTRIENAAGGLLFRLDTNGAERVQHLARSKHLMIFTNEAEYFVSDRAIVRGTPPNVPQSSRNGSAPGIRPVESDGGMLYVGKSRSIIYTATYSDVSQSYESTPISLLASHLTTQIKSKALQRSSLSTDASRLWVVRDDGQMTVGVMIRNQDVTAFVRFVTDGQVRDVCVDGANVTWLLIERQVGAGRQILRERVDAAAILHQQRSFAFGAPTDHVTGLWSLEGASVWAFADGYAQGPFTVTAGTITLPYPASAVTVGRWTPPRVRTLPLPRLVGERVVLQRPVRVHTVRAHLLGTTSLAIAANGRPARDVPLLRGGETSDQPIQPFDGPASAQGLFGWSDDGFVEFTQLRPGAFRVRSITVEARI